MCAWVEDDGLAVARRASDCAELAETREGDEASAG